jgi:hypothetical protein
LYECLLWPMLAEAAQLPHDEYRPVGLFAVYHGQLPDPAVRVLFGALIAAGVVALAGWRYSVSGPAFALLNLLLLSYRNSWGYIQHGEKLAVVHLLIVACSPAADAWSLDARRRARQCARPAPAGAYGWPVQLMAAVTVITYVISAATKLRYSGVSWITSDIVRNAVAWVALRNEVLGLPHSVVAPMLLGEPLLFKAIAAFTIAIELGSPVAFIPRWRTWWIGGAILMHWGIFVLMLIPFPYHLLGLAYLPFMPVERWAGQRQRAVRGEKAVRARCRMRTRQALP